MNGLASLASILVVLLSLATTTTTTNAWLIQLPCRTLTKPARIASWMKAYINGQQPMGPGSSPNPTMHDKQRHSNNDTSSDSIIPSTGTTNNNSSSPSTSSPSSSSSVGTLGDIMSNGLMTSTSIANPHNNNSTSPSTLASQFGIHSPLDRVLLTANGNLQRLLSSYYDIPVHVVVQECRRQPPQNNNNNNNDDDDDDDSSLHCYYRVVHLTIQNRTVCTATTHCTVHDPQCQEWIRTGQVGLGQLFRHLDRLPTFHLINAGYQTNANTVDSQQQSLWRVYRLMSPEITCEIREDFSHDVWDIVIDPVWSEAETSKTETPKAEPKEPPVL